MRYLEIIETSGDDFFNMENHISDVYNDRSRETLVYMAPSDFLKLAENGYDDEKMTGVRAVTGKFKSIPSLSFQHDNNGNAWVSGHEGRHRARLMIEKGVTEIPVKLISIEGPGRGIRWGQQKENNYTIPKTLKSQNGDFAIPFPKSVIYPHD